MNQDFLRKRLAALGLVLGSLVALIPVWYAYLVLQRATIYLTILATLALASCALAGIVYLIAERYEERWFVLNPEHLGRGQNLMLAIGGLILAVCSLWAAMSPDVSAFLHGGFGNDLSYALAKVIIVVGFFLFGISSGIRIKYVLRQRSKR